MAHLHEWNKINESASEALVADSRPAVQPARLPHGLSGYVKARTRFGHGTAGMDEWLEDERHALLSAHPRETVASMIHSAHLPSIIPAVSSSSSSFVYRVVYNQAALVLPSGITSPPTRTAYHCTRAIRRRLHTLTAGALEGLDWSHISMGGTIVLRSVLEVEIPGLEPFSEFASRSPIILFCHGATSSQLPSLLQEVYEVYSINVYGRTNVSWSMDVASIESDRGPVVEVQLAAYKSSVQWALHEAVDALAMVWTGSDVLLAPWAVSSLETSSNVLSPRIVTASRRNFVSETLEYSLLNLVPWGFGIRVSDRDADSQAKERLLSQFVEAERVYEEVAIPGRMPSSFSELQLLLADVTGMLPTAYADSCAGLILYIVFLREALRKEVTINVPRTHVDGVLRRLPINRERRFPRLSRERRFPRLSSAPTTHGVVSVEYETFVGLAPGSHSRQPAGWIPFKRTITGFDIDSIIHDDQCLSIPLILPWRFYRDVLEVLQRIVGERADDALSLDPNTSPELWATFELRPFEILGTLPSDATSTKPCFFLWIVSPKNTWKGFDSRLDRLIDVLLAFRSVFNVLAEHKDCTLPLVTEFAQKRFRRTVCDEISLVRWLADA